MKTMKSMRALITLFTFAAVTCQAATLTIWTNLTATPLLLPDDGIVIYRGTNPPFLVRASNFVSLIQLDTTQYTNWAEGGLTNMSAVTVPGNTMTNDGEGIIFTAAGDMKATGIGTNTFQVVWGSKTLFSTGALVNSNASWVITGKIIRTGNTNAIAMTEGWWTGGATYHRTNAVEINVWETNGIDTVLAIKATSTDPMSVTQQVFRVERLR